MSGLLDEGVKSKGKSMNKILVIDDQKDNLTALSALLEYFIPDCSIATAASGIEGIRIAENWQPDAILLDIFMPVMDGYEVCERLKSGKETAHIPVIMLTAIRTDSKSRVRGLESGADAFLTKPIDSSELAAQVKAMLRIKKIRRQVKKGKGSPGRYGAGRGRRSVQSEPGT